MWAMTGMPETLSLAMCGSNSTPPSIFTAWAPASFMKRTAVCRHCSGETWYEPKGRSAMTKARRVDRVTARTSGSSSSTVTAKVESLPNTLLDAESPTSRTGMPASSKITALYMSYAVSIAHLRPSTFICLSCGMRRRVAGLVRAVVS